MKTLLLAASLLATLPLSAAPGQARPARYTPDGGDFVITNGGELFNRPLYGGNSGFRIEAGDRPEFALFLPGRGGNLRLGLLPDDPATKPLWLSTAKWITALYRPGSMVYTIRDPRLGDGGIVLTAIPMAGTEGLIVRVETVDRIPPGRLLWAFGGVKGDLGRRNGDLNAENERLSRFFQFKPAHCAGNSFKPRPDGFTLPTRTGTLVGLAPGGPAPQIADGTKWDDPAALLASAGKPGKTPVVVGTLPLAAGRPTLLGLHLVRPKQLPKVAAKDLPQAFTAAETHRREIAGRLALDTPDPHLNAAAAALSVAADAIWDERQGAYMHGACAWRVKLLGWRAAYAGDALGWHDRTRRHLAGFARQQVVTPPPEKIPPADEAFNLARNESALHSHGDFAVVEPRHYNMNLVAVDTLFRHLQWTGDLAFAAEMWPVIERHLAREQRLFRRPFGTDPLPLYEAYACIWASDELAYHGGGTTHASAYNFWHHQMAARLATLLGKDPAPYQLEAERIGRAMRRELWLPDRGWFAEFKDLLGTQAVHPEAAAWSFYHTLDSRAATPLEAWQYSRFVDTRLARIPIHGPGVEPGLFTLPTSNWMPYKWSVNNVALAESAHSALAYWQAGRGDAALPLLKGALLDTMFMSDCPGNVGMTSRSDVFSGERYRDFADAVGITARALVEGLFGIEPDLLAGRLRLRPGFPADWNYARLRHPRLDFAFQRDGLKESYEIATRLARPVEFVLEIPALRDGVAELTVNGRPADWRALPDSVGTPRLEIRAPAAERHHIVIRWQGEAPAPPVLPAVRAQDAPLLVEFAHGKPLEIADPQGVLHDATLADRRLQARTRGTAGHRSAFVRREQGALQWWQPLDFELRPALEVLPSPKQDADTLRFRLRNNGDDALEGTAVFTVADRSQRQALVLPAGRESAEIVLPAAGLPPGSHPLAVAFGKAAPTRATLVNWHLKPASAIRWEPIDLTPHFNDAVTRIFQNEYRSPRSPFCSLALPKQGIGGWCHYQFTTTIDDRGLRAAGGLLETPLGIPFRSPTAPDAKNIVFTSQWDNYPREAAIPLAGRASRACLLMAGSTHAMQCRFDNAEVVATYADGSTDRLVLHSPLNWWPIEQDYHIDAFAFARPEPVPPRLDLLSGKLRVMDPADCQARGRIIPGGAATVLDLPLDPAKDLRSITVRCLGNEVVVGLMALTLAREPAPQP